MATVPIENRADADRLLRGRRIVKVRLNRRSNGHNGWAYFPELTLDSGDVLWFEILQAHVDYSDYCVRLVVEQKATR